MQEGETSANMAFEGSSRRALARSLRAAAMSVGSERRVGLEGIVRLAKTPEKEGTYLRDGSAWI